MSLSVFHCERCQDTVERKGYDEGIDPESAALLRLAEVQTNFGVLVVMCIKCRREWMRWLNKSQAMREYLRTGFRLEHWRMAHRKTGKEDVETGVKLVDILNELDERLYNEAWAWIKAGPAAGEKSRAITKRLRSQEDGEDDSNEREFDVFGTNDEDE